MINSFLVSLQNSATQPVNAMSDKGDVLWPDNVQVKSFTDPLEDRAQRLLFEGNVDNLARFLTAIQLLWVVEESVLADTITADDPRVTYTRAQLDAQFINETGWEQEISRILGVLEFMEPIRFLDGELLEIYRSALSPLDQLAAVVVYFGRRDD